MVAAQYHQAVAEKRGLVAWHCPTPTGASSRTTPCAEDRAPGRRSRARAPDHLHRRRHQTMQIWQWVQREPGKPARLPRAHLPPVASPARRCSRSSSAIAFTLDEEEALTLVDVTGRAAGRLRRRARHQALLRPVQERSTRHSSGSSRASPNRATASGTPR